MTKCAACGTEVPEDSTYMTEQGAVCADCNANAELADASKIRWMSAANIAAAVFLVGGFTCSLELNGV